MRLTCVGPIPTFAPLLNQLIFIVMKAIDLLQTLITFGNCNQQEGMYTFIPFNDDTELDELLRYFGATQFTGTMHVGSKYFYTYEEDFADRLNEIQMFDVEILDDYNQRVWLWRIED